MQEENESIRQLWMERTMDRVMGAADACLTCLYIMTSPNMPKRVYIEEVIDRVILFIKFHFHNTIFPSFDSTYRLDNKRKGKHYVYNFEMILQKLRSVNCVYTLQLLLNYLKLEFEIIPYMYIKWYRIQYCTNNFILSI